MGLTVPFFLIFSQLEVVRMMCLSLWLHLGRFVPNYCIEL